MTLSGCLRLPASRARSVLDANWGHACVRSPQGVGGSASQLQKVAAAPRPVTFSKTPPLAQVERGMSGGTGMQSAGVPGWC